MPKETKKRVSTLIQHMSLAEKVGQLFVLGYAGKDTEYAKTLVRDLHVGGFYLTHDNAETPQEAFQLTSVLNFEAQLRACDAPLLLAVDQEGAWGVLVEHTTTGPGNLALGSADNPDLTEQMHQVLAREIHTLGFNCILGPCSDINSNPDNPIIGVRSFGEETGKVAAHVGAAVTGLHSGGVVSSAKHFPGHGDTGEDSHRLLPTVEKSWDELRTTDLVPFQAAIDAGVDLVMTGHILYPKIDPDNPATLSKKILRDILRKKMGFDGLIITDSMNMWAMRKNYAPDAAAVRALAAGADLIMLSEEHYENQRGGYKETQRATIHGVIRAVERGELAEKVIDAALTRVLSIKYQRAAFTPPVQLEASKLQMREHREIAEKSAGEAIKVLRNRADLWPLGGDEFTLVGASNPAMHQRVIDTRGIGPNEPLAAFEVFKQELKKLNSRFVEVSYDLLDTLLAPDSRARIKLPLVIVTEDYPLPGLDYDAEQQAEIVQRAVEKFGDSVVVVALRSDYELQRFTNLSTYVCAYSSRACSARAIANLFSYSVEQHYEVSSSV
ncbi:glycoside hydrolase family 3 protein [Microbulbifer aggregans]|uniref:glycoside hydrolase family 3 protein n=1 Tax=Microbulbifer aggregans TaxID=1769779 RepID=UPI001CFD4216|nr:glycoside hydrolase family 3 protein [Microbulbifer aggregans]